MSKYEEAELILKLYDLRREPTMRQARDWYFREFNPTSVNDIMGTMFSEHSGHLRMVLSYWDMAAGLVNHGAISKELFTDTNGEYLGVYAKIEPFLPELRKNAPQMLTNLEKMIDSISGERERLAFFRDRMKAIQAEMASRMTKGAGKS
jgi:hypothetical protein